MALLVSSRVENGLALRRAVRMAGCWALRAGVISRPLIALVTLMLILLASPNHKAAAQSGPVSPTGCAGSTLAITLGPGPGNTGSGPNGTVAEWKAEVSNVPTPAFPKPCDLVNAEIVYCCPDPTTGSEVGGMGNSVATTMPPRCTATQTSTETNGTIDILAPCCVAAKQNLSVPGGSPGTPAGAIPLPDFKCPEVFNGPLPQPVAQADHVVGTLLNGFNNSAGDFKDQSFEVLPCNVKVDKQVSCDGGVTFVDQGFVTANEDGTISCAGVVGQTGAIKVRYIANNPNGFDLFGCTATETNTGITNTPIVFNGTCNTTTGKCDDGVTSCTSNAQCPFFHGNGTCGTNGVCDDGFTPCTSNAQCPKVIRVDVPPLTCSASLAASEPDTATLKCFCTPEQNVNFTTSAFDTASFCCLTPCAEINKTCKAQGDPTATVTGDCTNEGDIDVVNCSTGSTTSCPAGVTGVNFTSCTVSDKVFPGSTICSGTPTPVTAISPNGFALTAGSSQPVTATITGLTKDSCDEADVTCHFDLSAAHGPSGDVAGQPGPPPTTNQATCPVPQPDDTVMKLCAQQTGSPPSNAVTITVTNPSATSQVPLDGCVLNDSYFTGDTDGDNNCSTFPPGASTTPTVLIPNQPISEIAVGGSVTVNSNITGLTAPACNRATLTMCHSKFCSQLVVPPKSSDANCSVQHAQVSISKTCSGQTHNATTGNDENTVTITVTNTGGQFAAPLTNCMVTDTLFPNVATCGGTGGTVKTFPPFALSANGSTQTLTFVVANLAKDTCDQVAVTCDSPVGQASDGTDPANLRTAICMAMQKVAVSKECSLQDASFNSTITVHVTNQGTGTLTNCTITDTLFQNNPTCSGTGGTPVTFPDTGPILPLSVPKTETATVSGLTFTSCDSVTVDCLDESGMHHMAGPATAECPVCTVQLDKQVSGDSGVTFKDVGDFGHCRIVPPASTGTCTVSSNGKLGQPCTTDGDCGRIIDTAFGWDGEPTVQYRLCVQDSGGANLINCVVTDPRLNGHCSGSPTTHCSAATPCPSGQTCIADPIPGLPTSLNSGAPPVCVTIPNDIVSGSPLMCSAAFQGENTAQVTCTCQGVLNQQATDTDTANLKCLSTGVSVMKQCCAAGTGANGVPCNNTVSTPTGTFTYDISVMNTQPAGEATLINCQVQDSVVPGTCPTAGCPALNSSPMTASVGTVPPSTSVPETLRNQTLNATSCNTAVVMCDILDPNETPGASTCLTEPGTTQCCVRNPSNALSCKHVTDDTCAQCNVTPSTCPNQCVNPTVGAAAGCTVLELDGSSVSITGPAGGIKGDICIGPNGQLSITGSEFVTGNIRLSSGATFSKSGSGTIGGQVERNQDLSAQINAAKNVSLTDAGLACTQTFTSIKSSTTIQGVGAMTGGAGGVNVICVRDLVLNSGIVNLVGANGDTFVVNVTGQFVLNGNSHLRAVGIPSGAILYNVIGTGAQVAFTGGGGGTNCCNSTADGTLIALQRDIALSPGLVNGQLIGGQKISIVSGSSVNCPCPAPS